MKRNKSKWILFAVMAMILNSSCHSRVKEVPETMLTGMVDIAADESLQPMMSAELDVFQGLYNYATINCSYVSEYDAINLLLQEKIRLAIVTRPLNQKEIDFFKSRKIIPESIPLAYDAIAVIVNPENKMIRLSTDQISQLLSGTVSDWKQISSLGKTGMIKMVFDAKSSGVIRSMNDSLHLNKKISGSFTFSGTSQKVIESVAADADAIGFVGFNWLSEKENRTVQESLKKVRLLAISTSEKADSTNSFEPTTATLFDGHYPLIRKIYAVYTDPSASLARGFLAHLTSERGQKIIYRMGLKPEDDFQRLVTIKKDL